MVCEITGDQLAGSAPEPRKSTHPMGPDELHAMSSMLPWKAPLKNGEKNGTGTGTVDGTEIR